MMLTPSAQMSAMEAKRLTLPVMVRPISSAKTSRVRVSSW